jgi:MYXO-CTERM domain-containing protein
MPALQLKVQLAIIPPAAPNPPADPDPPGRPRLSGVPKLPRHRGCASCSTAAEPQDVLLPLGLTVLGLYALRRRKNGHDA